jgi:hypothetical protein
MGWMGASAYGSRVRRCRRHMAAFDDGKQRPDRDCPNGDDAGVVTIVVGRAG